jgi:uncharacterized protein YggT (Ycf19 family)
MLLAPFALTFLFWIAVGPLFGALKLGTDAKSFLHLAGQAAVIGLSAWLVWPYLLAVVLLLHTVSSYVYLGKSPFLNFITTTARNLLRPLAPLPLQIGKIDFAPLLMLGLLALVIAYAPGWLTWLYRRSMV